MLENPRLCNACDNEGKQTKAKQRSISHTFKVPARDSQGELVGDERYDTVTVGTVVNEYVGHRDRYRGGPQDSSVDLCKRHWREALQGMLDKL